MTGSALLASSVFSKPSPDRLDTPCGSTYATFNSVLNDKEKISHFNVQKKAWKSATNTKLPVNIFRVERRLLLSYCWIYWQRQSVKNYFSSMSDRSRGVADAEKQWHSVVKIKRKVKQVRAKDFLFEKMFNSHLKPWHLIKWVLDKQKAS